MVNLILVTNVYRFLPFFLKLIFFIGHYTSNLVRSYGFRSYYKRVWNALIVVTCKKDYITM